MKKFLFSILSISLMLAFSSCEKDRAFVEFDDLEHGAYARLVSKTGVLFVGENNTQVDIFVEFYDDNKGQNVTDYNWTVEYIDKVHDGAESAGPVDILSIPSSSFGTNAATGLPSAEFSFVLQDLLDALSLTDIGLDDGGNTFRFAATIKTTSGQTFTSANTGGSVISSAPISALFSFDADLTCPSYLSGVLTVSSVGWCGGQSEEYVVEWVETEAEGIYNVVNPASPEDGDSADFSYGAYFICYSPATTLPGGSLQVKDACNIIAPIGSSRWGEVYWYNDVSTDGATLVIDWENDYGEGGVSTLVRQDGTDWPDLVN